MFISTVSDIKCAKEALKAQSFRTRIEQALINANLKALETGSELETIKVFFTTPSEANTEFQWFCHMDPLCKKYGYTIGGKPQGISSWCYCEWPFSEKWHADVKHFTQDGTPYVIITPVK